MRGKGKSSRAARQLQQTVVEALSSGKLPNINYASSALCEEAFGDISTELGAQRFKDWLNEQVKARTNGRVVILYNEQDNDSAAFTLLGVCLELRSVTQSLKFRYAPHNPLRKIFPAS